MKNTSPVALITLAHVSHPVFPYCFRGAGEWTRGRIGCDYATRAIADARRLQADWCECASAPRITLPRRRGNRCAA